MVEGSICCLLNSLVNAESTKDSVKSRDDLSFKEAAWLAWNSDEIARTEANVAPASQPHLFEVY